MKAVNMRPNGDVKSKDVRFQLRAVAGGELGASEICGGSESGLPETPRLAWNGQRRGDPMWLPAESFVVRAL